MDINLVAEAASQGFWHSPVVLDWSHPEVQRDRLAVDTETVDCLRNAAVPVAVGEGVAAGESCYCDWNWKKRFAVAAAVVVV